VLLVDDHRGVLERVSAMLAADFDVAGTATEGTAAVELARRIDPDVIVLDVHMAGLDGFQTIDALRQDGATAPVVFLSMAETDDHVAEAFRRGGRGYVIKSRVPRDLAAALDQVLRGRMFAPSLTSLVHQTHDCGHGLHLRGGSDSCLDELASFFDLALRRGDATCVMASEEIRDGLVRRLRPLGWEMGGAAGHKRCRVVDADDALGSFMRNGRPDAGILAEIVAELDQYRRATTDSISSRLTIFGNLAGVLVDDGNVEGALALESLWDSLTRGLPFLTLCGYSEASFDEDRQDLWARLCAQHQAVVPASIF
jgi:DNA-binding response OmpR family regulator